MPLTPEEERELAELEELERLEAMAAEEPKLVQMPVQEIEGDPGPLPSRAQNAVDQAVSGATFGLSDYASAAGESLGSQFSDHPRSFSDSLTHVRSELERGRRAYPESTPINVAAGMAQGGGLARQAGLGLGKQTALGAGVGGVSGAAESGGDPRATLTGAAVGAAAGRLGGSLSQRAARKAAERAAQAHAVRTPGFGNELVPGPAPAVQQTASRVAKELGEMRVSDLAQAGLREAAVPGAGLAKAAKQIPGAVKEAVSSGAARAAEGAAKRGIPQATASGATTYGAGIHGPLMESLRSADKRKREETSMDSVRRAYVGGQLTEPLRQELAEVVEAGDRKALAAKVQELQMNPTLAGELDKHLKGGK